MKPEDVQKMIDNALATRNHQQQYGVSQTSFHNHNGINSPVIKTPVTSYVGYISSVGTAGAIFPEGWDVEFTTGQATITGLAVTITFTGALAPGATTATLNAVWPGTTGTETVYFSSGEFRTVTFTNGNTAVSWTGGLAFAATASANEVGQVPIGTTAGTLPTPWGGVTGTFPTYFSDGETLYGTYTNGGLAVSFGSAKTRNATSTATVYNLPPYVYTIVHNLGNFNYSVLATSYSKPYFPVLYSLDDTSSPDYLKTDKQISIRWSDVSGNFQQNSFQFAIILGSTSKTT